MTLKRTQVMLMPTKNEKSTLCLVKVGNNKPTLSYSSGYNGQELYFLSDEEIKEGENTWYYDSFTKKIYNSGGAEYEHTEQCKKIICTTDSYLGIEKSFTRISKKEAIECINNARERSDMFSDGNENSTSYEVFGYWN